MGNRYSTRWGSHTKKLTVEALRMQNSLDIHRWKQKNLLRPQVHQDGILEWKRTDTGEVIKVIPYELNMLDTIPWIEFSYTVIPFMRSTAEHVVSRVYLQTSRRGRYYFSCPLLVGNTPCGRHVEKLYLPPGRKYYGCWRCHALTYTSSQTSHVHKCGQAEREFAQTPAGRSFNAMIDFLSKYLAKHAL